MNGKICQLRGFTLIELLVAAALAALILAAISGLVRTALGSSAMVAERNLLHRDARFAMDRMTRAVTATRHLLLPLPDKPDTDWRENVREQTVPESAPEGSSVRATAVLALSLGIDADLDGDGFPDADNDRDGRIDEDWPADANYDFAAGVYSIDDDGFGFADDSFSAGDDDERFHTGDEDPLNGLDDDGDGIVDEDAGADMNGDGAPGIRGVDDDGDGQIDEGSNGDDDEDGVADEDWLDTVAFYLQDDTLIERHPVPWDESGVSGITGRDFVESAIADNVTRFRVERPVPTAGGKQLVDLTLELTGPSGAVVALSIRMQVGGAL